MLRIVLGDQLFPAKYFDKKQKIFMAETWDLCTRYDYHKQKIYHTLASMRHFAELMEKKNFQVHYSKLDPNKKPTFLTLLSAYIKKHKVDKLVIVEPADQFMRSDLIDFAKKHHLNIELEPNPSFMIDVNWFASYMEGRKRPFMKTFYEKIRRETGILMTGNKPLGGKFSFDSDNRKKLPKDFEPAPIKTMIPGAIEKQVIKLVNRYFHNHPGTLEQIWLPVTRAQALKQWRGFLNHRMEKFGDFQDALHPKNPFLYHSLISASMNIGHLLPEEIIEDACAVHEDGQIPLNSTEGFVRQILGWREFIRLIYESYSSRLYETNHFNHQRQLTPSWYHGTTGLPPMDDAIHHAQAYGYCHHIQRLMVAANLMNLCEIEPTQAYRWFMEMFVDVGDWVMAANVFGMGLMSDGGIFATKPYIAGSNYIRKMSHYSKGPWCDIWDGLYWRFVHNKRDVLTGNPRLSLMVKSFDKMDTVRRKKILRDADHFLSEHTF